MFLFYNESNDFHKFYHMLTFWVNFKENSDIHDKQ